MAETGPSGSANGPPAARVIVVPHTHWDREWYRPFQDFRRRLVRLVDRLLDVLEADETFVHFHLDGQTIVLEDYLEIRPQARARLARLIAAKRIAAGPWYLLPDEFLVSGESIVRNLQLGRGIAGRFGEPPAIGYLPDQFGHIAQMPQILRGFGIDSAVVWRGVGADVQRTEFSWVALDGSAVFAVYLPYGYSNGRALPGTAGALRDRLRALLAELEPFRRISSALIMAGTDHQEAQPGLPALLGEAVRGLEGVTAEIGSLTEYVARARAEAGVLPAHRGELRSAQRAHLLPGVASARIRQKQRDFDNVGRLERHAEPLAVWADALAGRRTLSAFTDWAWKTALQNHPHDSICGCSIDQVHRDMEYRFDQVDLVVRDVVQQGLAAVAAAVETGADGDPRLVVFNPNPAGTYVVEARLPLEDADLVSLAAADGSPVAVDVDAGPAEVLFDVALPPEALRQHVETIQGREFLGSFINRIAFARHGECLDVAITVDRQPRGRLDVAAERARWLQFLDDPGVRLVRARASTARMSRLVFAAPLEGWGLTVFAVRRHAPAAGGGVSAGQRAVENRWYRVTARDDGSLSVLDKELGLALPRCNWFVDEGDRGDEYNFDPVPGTPPVDAPVAAPEVAVEAGAVVRRLRIRSVYRVPRRLAADRQARCPETVALALTTTVALYAGVKRIDFATELENAAEDHRLRVRFETPLRPESVHVEQAFGVVTRPLDLEPSGGVEQPVGTGPQKTFAALCDGGRGVALFNRGIPEVEAERAADGTALCLTLLRSVGWLSRGDLALRSGHAGPGLETPEAQSLGAHRFEYALTTFAGDLDASRLVAGAHGFAYPPLAALTDAHAGAPPRGAGLVECDNPLVVVAAIAAGRQPGRFTVRCYNASAAPQAVALRFPGARRVRSVDLRGGAVTTGVRCRGGAARGTMRPFEIASFDVARGGPGRRGRAG